MSRIRIIRITVFAAAALALFLGGCFRIDDPEPGDGFPIAFDAGHKLLRHDATKADDDLITGTEFEDTDAITVFGRRHGATDEEVVFPGTTVTKEGSEWSYSPHRFWKWESDSDYYDFIGVYPADDEATRMEIPGNLAVKVPYDVENNDHYDLLLAGSRRYGNIAGRMDAVELTFNHALSAVRVVVVNESQDVDITLDAYWFQYVIVKAWAKATFDAFGDPEFSWIDTQRKGESYHVRPVTPAMKLWGKSHVDPAANPPRKSQYSGEFDLFIPADLTETSNGSSSELYMPHLILQYTVGSDPQTTQYLLLKDIQRNPRGGDTTPIDRWEPGVKYVYTINIRLDGGVIVTVTTTPWDPVMAETPGLLID